MTKDFSNRLVKETSPYLLQHAHNPVEWFPWGEEALLKAKQENKPILVSIGYAACHWCHVMEEESFEDIEIAGLMNKNFVNIKVDREERPDLDHIYMDAVQAISGAGGWPLNVFLTPDAKPFFGGTYFPPKPFHNRPSWKQVLMGVAESFKNKKSDIESQAENLMAYLAQSNLLNQHGAINEQNIFENTFNKKNLDKIFENTMRSADKDEGGFGIAPKFPQTFTIQFLLHYYYFTKNESALQQATLSLDKMIQGGIYDQIGGGFARYSTDREWLVPHFEKMLYDNALLIIVLSESYQITKKKSHKQAIEETIEFVKREMTSQDGAFFSSLDADSEGKEGKYYVWEKKEIDEALKEDADLFCSFYNVLEKGNWEGKNILHKKNNVEEFAIKASKDVERLVDTIEKSKIELFKIRQERIAPPLDYKTILGWNALMNIALSKAYAALGNEDYKVLAIRNMNCLLENFNGTDGFLFFHSNTNNQKKYPAFLDDHAFLISALIQLHEITSDEYYLLKAKELCEYVIENFSDHEGAFFYTHKDQKDIILRKKEIYDGAIPSGNSVMAFNLLYLSIFFGLNDWKEKAINISFTLSNIIINYPGSFGVWATLMQAITYNIPEIVITGTEINDLREGFLRNFIPYKIFQSATQETNQFPLLSGKPVYAMPQIYLCKDYSCQKPVTEIAELLDKIEELQKINIGQGQ